MPYFSLGLLTLIALLGMVAVARPDVVEHWKRERDAAKRHQRGPWL